MIDDVIRIRVYNVGFGDCVKLDMPTTSGRRATVLIDCGSLSFGDTGQNHEGLVNKIVGDITGEVGVPRIDLVVATHRHRDHISGFGRPEWSDVSVGEVWLPWTDDPDDPGARQLFRAQHSLAMAISESEPKLRANEKIANESKDLILAMAMNALSSDESLGTLRYGFAGEPTVRYLSRSYGPRTPRVLGGSRVHVLGPTRNPEVLKQMDPPSGQSYLAMLPGPVADGEEGDRDRPFPNLPRMDWRSYTMYEGDDREIHAAQAKGQLRGLVEIESLFSAATLDYALNNTSLMLMFEVGDQFLLFPGDAQWGSWNTAMNSDKSGALLGKTTFYKVGHHGSHNATPKRFVEEFMPDDCWAVASVASYSRWKSVPKAELMERLGAKAPNRVLATNDLPTSTPPAMVVEDGGLAVDFVLPTRMRRPDED